mgnify:CR=1 FL=1
MQQLKTMIEGFVNKNVIPLGVTAIFVVIVIMGFAFLAPGHKAKEWAKEHVLWLIIGAALIYTGSRLGNRYCSKLWILEKTRGQICPPYKKQEKI